MTLRFRRESFPMISSFMHNALDYGLIISLCSVGLPMNSASANEQHSLTNLTLREVVYVINDSTHFQINLELLRDDNGEMFDLTGVDLDQFTLTDLRAVLRRSKTYELITNEIAFIIAPRTHELNHVVSNFVVTNVHPFLAGYMLGHHLPFILDCQRPFPFDHTVAPGFMEVDLPHWPTNALSPISLNLTNTSVRDVLCRLFNSQRKAYWITCYPVQHKKSLFRRKSKIISLEVFCPEDECSNAVHFSRNPSYLEWKRNIFEHPSKATKPWQPNENRKSQ